MSTRRSQRRLRIMHHYSAQCHNNCGYCWKKNLLGMESATVTSRALWHSSLCSRLQVPHHHEWGVMSLWSLRTTQKIPDLLEEGGLILLWPALINIIPWYSPWVDWRFISVIFLDSLLLPCATCISLSAFIIAAPTLVSTFRCYSSLWLLGDSVAPGHTIGCFCFVHSISPILVFSASFFSYQSARFQAHDPVTHSLIPELFMLALMHVCLVLPVWTLARQNFIQCSNYLHSEIDTTIRRQPTSNCSMAPRLSSRAK